MKYFIGFRGCTVAMEAGTHSAWVSRVLAELGHRVLIGNPRRIRAIWDSSRKCDARDAEVLARTARFDPSLLSPVVHRGPEVQAHLQILKSREALVQARASRINPVRTAVKSVDERSPRTSPESFDLRMAEKIPDLLRPALDPMLKTLGAMTVQIRAFDTQVERLLEERYPETGRLRKIGGVGPLTSPASVLVLESPERFQKSRDVGAYLGLVPRRDQAGETDKQLHITKEGHGMLRRLLVGAAHYIVSFR